MQLFKNKKDKEAEAEQAADALLNPVELEGYYNPDAETPPETAAQETPKVPARSVSKPKGRRYGLGMRALSGLAAVLCLFSMTTSAWYFNDFMRSASTRRSLPTVTRGLTPNMQKISYAPAVSFALRLVTSSTELDLGVTVIDEYDAIVTGYPFEVQVTPVGEPDAKPVTAVDEDLDGQVDFSDLEAGEYKVELTKAEGYIMPDPVVAEVMPRVTYAYVDVSDKVVSASEIDAATDDPQYGGNHTGTETTPSTPPTSSDTVDYVPSSQTSESETREKDKLINGVPYYNYKPTRLTSDSRLMYADGTESDIYVRLDENGYILSGYRMVEVPDPVPAPETPPAEPSAVVTPDEGTATEAYVEAASADVSADGEEAGVGGLEQVEVQLFDENHTLLNDPVTGKAFAVEAIKATEIITDTVTTYYGWQTIDNRTYYFDKNGVKVTGWQTIDGVTYFFNDDGVRGGSTGIDVSTWQENINWAQVKAAGVDFVIIRLGFRGYGTGKLVLDDMFYSHINGARSAGLKVGVYFFTQAINTQEAVEEASMCLKYVSGYQLDYPIAIDIEWAASNARTNNLTNAQRTEICRAFCETILSAGYKPCVYANKYYFTSLLNTPQLEQYVIWLAHYTEQTSYARKYDIWQYTSVGSVPGVPGNVDLNISYLGY